MLVLLVYSFLVLLIIRILLGVMAAILIRMINGNTYFIRNDNERMHFLSKSKGFFALCFLPSKAYLEYIDKIKNVLTDVREKQVFSMFNSIVLTNFATHIASMGMLATILVGYYIGILQFPV